MGVSFVSYSMLIYGRIYVTIQTGGGKADPDNKSSPVRRPRRYGGAATKGDCHYSTVCRKMKGATSMEKQDKANSETGEIAKEVFTAMKREIKKRLEVANEIQLNAIYHFVCNYVKADAAK